MLKRFFVEEEGANMVEYALLIVLIALIAAVGAQVLGNGLNNLFHNIGDVVDTVSVPSP